jgi:hypothetical protein
MFGRERSRRLGVCRKRVDDRAVPANQAEIWLEGADELVVCGAVDSLRKVRQVSSVTFDVGALCVIGAVATAFRDE